MLDNIQELIKAHEGITKEVYLDLENSSIVPKEIVEEMIPYFSEKAYGNPTVTHKPGWMAYEAIMKASEQIAKYIGAASVEEINFTPSETASNNLALVGTALANKKRGDKIVISEIEPLSIIFPSEMLEKQGFRTVKVPVDNEGFVNLENLAEAVDKKTILVSLMSINNEIGTIEPIEKAVKMVKEKNPDVLFHTDASDAYGRIPLSVRKLGIDIMTLSSSKILGPRGVGLLYVREGVNMEKLLEGQIGTQRLWPGVENTPLIMGFSKASELAFEDFNGNVSRMKGLRNRLIHEIINEIPETVLNGSRGNRRAPDNVNISILRCEGESLTIELSLNGIYVSSGSACTRRFLQPSHVLTSIGRKLEEAHGSILMKLTRYHKEEDIEHVLKVLPRAAERLRSISSIKRG